MTSKYCLAVTGLGSPENSVCPMHGKPKFSVSHYLILFWIDLIKEHYTSFCTRTFPVFPLDYHLELLFPQVSIEKSETDHLIFFKMNTNVLVKILVLFVCSG